jgi:hypothetical protein
LGCRDRDNCGVNNYIGYVLHDVSDDYEGVNDDTRSCPGSNQADVNHHIGYITHNDGNACDSVTYLDCINYDAFNSDVTVHDGYVIHDCNNAYEDVNDEAWSFHISNYVDHIGYITPDDYTALDRVLFLSCDAHNGVIEGDIRRIEASFTTAPSLPGSLGQLAALQALSLENNQLSSVPDSLDQLVALRRMCLGSNRFSSCGGTTLSLTRWAIPISSRT